jgi:hypothetical protein
MKNGLAVACLVLTTACPMPLSRPRPTETEYKTRFLGLLEPQHIHDLRFLYRGAVGGEYSVAKFTTDEDGLQVLHAAADGQPRYDPANAQQRREVERLQACCPGGCVPAWYDFPFNKSLLMYVEHADATEDTPGYLHEWYVDEIEKTVYCITVRD